MTETLETLKVLRDDFEELDQIDMSSKKEIEYKEYKRNELIKNKFLQILKRLPEKVFQKRYLNLLHDTNSIIILSKDNDLHIIATRGGISWFFSQQGIYKHRRELEPHEYYKYRKEIIEKLESCLQKSEVK